MLHNFFYTIAHLPMVWDFIAPLIVLALFCAVLFWEGEFGKAVKKHYRVRFKGHPH